MGKVDSGRNESRAPSLSYVDRKSSWFAGVATDPSTCMAQQVGLKVITVDCVLRLERMLGNNESYPCLVVCDQRILWILFRLFHRHAIINLQGHRIHWDEEVPRSSRLVPSC